MILLSVCGEDCSIQVCPICASPEVQSNIVDMILYRTLGDVDPDMETVDDMLITIPACGHVFTVETLDGLCDMSAFYDRNEELGKWVALKAPPSDYVKPPTCPTCRKAITCPRYGRVFKRADLDILERNVASGMSQSLQKVSEKMQHKSLEEMKDHLKASAIKQKEELKAAAKGDVKERAAKQKKLLREVRNIPLPAININAADALHGIPKTEVAAWRRGPVDVLFTAYREAVDITKTRYAHTHAWEASFSYLYKKEMDNAAQDPERAPRNPQEHAMRMAKMKVGQPQPRADMKFRVEALWRTVNIRLTLAELAQLWVGELFAGNVKTEFAVNELLWNGYIAFLLRSCKQDADITLEITMVSESRRQTIRTRLLLLRINLEQFRFNVEMSRRRADFNTDTRRELADRAHEKWAEAKQEVRAAMDEYTNRSRTALDEEREWLTEHFISPARLFLDEWQKLETSLRRDTFYEPLSLKEMTDVVKALNFCRSISPLYHAPF